MERHSFAMELKEGKKNDYRRKLGEIWPELTAFLDQENGTYILLSKFDDDVVFEYHITVMDDDFNLGVLTMRTPEGVFETDFDE